MESLGKTLGQAVDRFVATVAADLSALLCTEVKVHFYEDAPSFLPFDFNDYTLLEKEPDTYALQFSVYQENPALLTENIQEAGELKVCSHLLKSNCKITRQPDWGSLYIHLKGRTQPAYASLLKYIVSLRNENHFHEEICEMTFKRLSDLFQPEILMVSCLYTRRGGIDICPCRANKPDYLPHYLPQADILTQRNFRQ